MSNLFHYAFPVHDLDAARAFYGGVLRCREGRSDTQWVDFDLYGHQIVAHLSAQPPGTNMHNRVDGEDVPVPHFGVILSMQQWRELAERLRQSRMKFAIEPGIRFKGRAGEQATMFFYDPSGNALEFKAFTDLGQVFAKLGCLRRRA